MLSQESTISCTRHFQSRSLNSQLSKVKPSFDGYLIENSSPSFNGYRVKKESSVSTHLFRRKEGDFIVSEVTTSPSGTTKSRILNILKNIKSKCNKVRPSIRKMLWRLMGIGLLTIAVCYGLKYSLSQLAQNVPVRNNLQVGRYMVACTPNLVPRRRPMNPNRLVQPAFRAAAPTFEKAIGTGVWDQSGVSLMMPQPTFYRDVIAQYFYRRQMSQVLAPRGGVLMTPEMWLATIKATHAAIIAVAPQEIVKAGWGSYLMPLVPNAVQLVCYLSGNQGFARTCTILSTLHTIGQGAHAFSAMNPGPLGTPGNPITRMDQINQLKMPRRQTDQTPMGFLRNGTDLLLSVCTDQMYGKQKHYSGEYCPPGQSRLDVWARFIATLTLDPNTEFYRAIFNDGYNMAEDAVVALYRNATHNYGITYILGPGAEFLRKNLTLSPEKRALLGKVPAAFRTAYNLTWPQLKKLIERGKIQ